MVANSKAEQVADDDKKEYSTVSLDTADNKKKELEHSVKGLETRIAKAIDAIASLNTEVEALKATETQKDENEDYTERMAQDSAVKEVILSEESNGVLTRMGNLVGAVDARGRDLARSRQHARDGVRLEGDH